MSDDLIKYDYVTMHAQMIMGNAVILLPPHIFDNILRWRKLKSTILDQVPMG
jgi:hypothetical protein